MKVRTFRECPELSTRIEGLDIPQVGQRRFSELLERWTGCVLAWHERRRVFIVCRPDRGMSRSTFYPIEFGNEMYPLTSGLAHVCALLVRISDAFTNDDPAAAMRTWNESLADMAKADEAAMIDERMGDFRHELSWRVKAAEDGVRAARKPFWYRGESN